MHVLVRLPLGGSWVMVEAREQETVAVLRARIAERLVQLRRAAVSSTYACEHEASTSDTNTITACASEFADLRLELRGRELDDGDGTTLAEARVTCGCSLHALERMRGGMPTRDGTRLHETSARQQAPDPSPTSLPTQCQGLPALPQVNYLVTPSNANARNRNLLTILEEPGARDRDAFDSPASTARTLCMSNTPSVTRRSNVPRGDAHGAHDARGPEMTREARIS
jgi:hypothetical protein